MLKYATQGGPLRSEERGNQILISLFFFSLFLHTCILHTRRFGPLGIRIESYLSIDLVARETETRASRLRLKELKKIMNTYVYFHSRELKIEGLGSGLSWSGAWMIGRSRNRVFVDVVSRGVVIGV